MRKLCLESSSAVSSWVDSHRQEIVDVLKEIVSIPSVKAAPLPGMPYGEGCAKALEKGMEICSRYGLEAVSYDNYAASALWKNGPREIGFIAHLDVVPVSDNWLTDPFQPVEREGFVVGRGARDDKAGFTAALLALQCVRELGLPFSSSVRIIMGSDEECGMSDMDYYVKNCPVPDFSIVTDCYFPVAHGEKGRVCGDIVFPVDESKLVLTAGTAPNIIPSSCRAVLPGREQELEAVRKQAQEFGGVQVSCQGSDLILDAEGVSAHASEPSKAVNAIYRMGCFLSENNLLSGQEAAVADYIRSTFDCYYGERFGIEKEDAPSGKNTLITGMARTENGTVRLNIDSRICVSDNTGRVVSLIEKAVRDAGAKFILLSSSEAHYIPKDHPAVQQLTEVFNHITGEHEEAYIVAGGTYASHVPNSVAFGPGNKKEPSWFPASYSPGHGDAHQPDESQHIGALLDAVKIYALGILELDEFLNHGGNAK